TDFILTLMVPSGVARIVIMAAIALGLVDAFRVPAGSNVGRGMFLLITYCAALFDKMIIGGGGSITARGLIESAGQVEVQWSQWFVAFMPCDLITILAGWGLALWLFPPQTIELEGGRQYLSEQLNKLGPLSIAELKAGVLILLATALWMTDFIHHISPAKIGIGIGLAALLPVVGILRTDDIRTINFLPMFFVASALTMGHELAVTKGLDLITNAVFWWMEPLMTGVLTATAVLYWAAFA